MLFIAYQGKKKDEDFCCPNPVRFCSSFGSIRWELSWKNAIWDYKYKQLYLTYLWVVMRHGRGHGIPYGGRIDDLFELYLANISFFWNWLFLHYEIRFWIIFSSFRSTVHILFYVLLLCWLRCVKRYASVSIDMSYRQAEFLKTTRFC